MFAQATSTAREFTRPLAISHRTFDGKVSAGLAAFIVVNRDGWVLTAAHTTDVLKRHRDDKPTLDQYNTLIANGANHKQLKKHRPDSSAVTHAALTWGQDLWKVPTLQVDKLRDLVLGKVLDFNPNWVTSYPVFRDPKNMLDQGTSLCRLGYPFNHIDVTFDEGNNKFNLRTEHLPTFFPMDGIHTRRKIVMDESTGKQACFIETSTPGLRGQSGGPLYDVDGRVCGLQSHTESLPLGFSPKHKERGRSTTEHQYLNVGQAVCVEDILKLLDTHGVSYTVG